MRCGEKRFIVQTSDGVEHKISARTQPEARKKIREVCGKDVTIQTVRKLI